VVRANPGNYMQILRDDIAEAIAVAFDNAALHGTNSPFGDSIDDTTKSVSIGDTAQADGSVYGDIVAGLKALTDDGKKLTGFAFDRRAEAEVLGSVDTSGRPMFIDTRLDQTANEVTPGRLIGRPAYIGDNVYDADAGVLGYGGDWTQVVWGAVGGITYDVSTETTVTLGSSLVSLWENNLVAIRAEAE